MSYDILKNRLTNGNVFVKQTAIDRINALADNLEITQEQAEELLALAEANGVEVLPEDLPTRLAELEAVSAKFDAFVAAAKGNPVLSEIFDGLEVKS